MSEILLVEDDVRLYEIITEFLGADPRFMVTGARNGAQAVKLVEERRFDLVIMDILLPGKNGIDVLGQIRATVFCPVMFISCLDDEETMLQAFGMGGDDYLVKPFSPQILLAHVNALLRRTGTVPATVSGHAVLSCGDLVLDVARRTLAKRGEPVWLSPTEFSILRLFMENEGAVLTFEDIFRHVWSKPSYGDVRTVFAHVGNLRRKIEDDPAKPVYIRTCKKAGYVFGSLMQANPRPRQTDR